MKKHVPFLILILMPLTLFAQRKYPTGVTPYTLQMMNQYADNNEGYKAESILRSLGYKQTSYQAEFIGSTTTYIRNTRDGFGSEIYWSIGTGLCHNFSVKFFTSKGSNYFINLLKQSKYKLHYENGNKIWRQSGNSRLCDIGQYGRQFTILTYCA